MAVDNIARGMAAKALENQGGGGSSLPIVNTATVGQTIRVSAVDETGQPTEWEATDLPEPVQSNFNQNDDTAPDYIKNRTHYDASFYLDTSHIYGYYDFSSYFGFVRISEGVIDIPGDGLKAEYNGNVYDVSISELPHYGNSTTYEIEIDGNKYTVAINVAKENAVIYVYYNGTQYEVNNPNLGAYVIYDPSSINSVRASLYTEDVHKLDPKYLPDETKTLVVTYSDGGEHATHTSSEIYEAHEKGRVVQFVDYNSYVHQLVFVSTAFVAFVSVFDQGKSIVLVQDSNVSQIFPPQLVVSNTASVGQTIKITAVDENGQPAEWEAVDMTSGGGFRKIIDYTTEEQIFTPSITHIEFSKDLEGNAIRAENLYFKVSGIVTGGSGIRCSLNGVDMSFVDMYFGPADQVNVLQGFISFSAGAINYMAPRASATVEEQRKAASGEKITAIRFSGPNYNAVHLEAGARIEVWEVGNA